MKDNKTQTESPLSTILQRDLDQNRINCFEFGVGSVSDKLNSISRFQSRQYVAKDIAYYLVFSIIVFC